MTAENKITITETERDLLVQSGKHEAKIDQLEKEVQEHSGREERYLKEIFTKLDNLQRQVSSFPLEVSRTRQETERYILDHMKEYYYSKDQARADQRSLKIFITTVVGTCTLLFTLLTYLRP